MIIDLRWYVTCDENGVKSEPILQYQDEFSDWYDAGYCEMKA